MSTSSPRSSSVEVRRQQASQATKTADAKAVLNQALVQVAGPLDAELQERGKTIHANDKALAKQEKDLQKHTKMLAKTNDSLEKFVTASNKQLDALGDLEGIEAGLEDDLADLEEILRLVEEDAAMQSEEHGEDPSHRG